MPYLSPLLVVVAGKQTILNWKYWNKCRNAVAIYVEEESCHT